MGSTIVTLLVVAGQSLALYVFLVAAMRLLGRRHMAQLSTAEFMVVAMLGSSVETGLYAGQSSVASGFVSAATLLLANQALTLVVARAPWARRLLIGVPTVLVRDGQVIQAELRRAHLTERDLEQAVRRRGYERVQDVALAVLEANGSVGVVPVED